MAILGIRTFAKVGSLVEIPVRRLLKPKPVVVLGKQHQAMRIDSLTWWADQNPLRTSRPQVFYIFTYSFMFLFFRFFFPIISNEIPQLDLLPHGVRGASAAVYSRSGFTPELSQLTQDFHPRLHSRSNFTPELSQLNQDFHWVGAPAAFHGLWLKSSIPNTHSLIPQVFPRLFMVMSYVLSTFAGRMDPDTLMICVRSNPNPNNRTCHRTCHNLTCHDSTHRSNFNILASLNKMMGWNLVPTFDRWMSSDLNIKFPCLSSFTINVHM